MSKKTMVVTFWDDEGETVEVEFPSVRVVCDDCEGEGTVLTPSIRNHCYSMEEFNEEFSEEEDRAAYFTRGGIYDVRCPTCEGKRVRDVIDHEAAAKEMPTEYAAYEEWKKARDTDEWEREAERAMGA